MSKIQFENGITVDFEGTPTPQDVEEVAQHLGLRQNQEQMQQPQPNPAIQSQQPDSGMQKAGNFFDTLLGGKTIGTAIGAKAGKYLPQSVTGLRPEDKQYYDTSAPSAGAIAADVGRTGINFLPGAGQAGLGTRLAVNAATGAGYNVLDALRTGQKPTAQGVDTSAVLGAFIPEAVSLVGRGAGHAVKLFSQALIQNATGKTAGEIGREIYKTKGNFENTFAAKYLDEGKWYRSARSAVKDARTNILPELGKHYETVKNSEYGGRFIPINDLAPTLKRIGQKLSKDAISEEERALVKSLQNINTTNLSVRKALELRHAIYAYTPKGAFDAISENPASKALKNTAGKLAGRIQEATGDMLIDDTGRIIRAGNGAKGMTMKQLDNTYALYAEATKGFAKKTGQKSIGQTEKMLALGGLVSIPGTAALIAGERIARSTPVQLGAAFTANKARKVTEKVVSHQATKHVARKGFFSLLSGFNQRTGRE